MKLLTIAIPVYNTEKYIKRCLDSLLIAEITDDLEIILVNDGSTDNSIEIINKYQKEYPNCITVIDKQNGGHGSTINAALKIATGKYFRVIDSDDWVNSKDFSIFVNNLGHEDADLIITNYSKEFVYNGVSEKLVWKSLEENIVYNFDTFDLKNLNKEYFVMANSTYKTEILRKSNLKLLENTFYVDMQYNVVPILCTKTFKFMNLDIYRYFIGRPEQSMNLQNFIKNRTNHENVMKYLIEYFNSNFTLLSENKKNYIEQILFYMLNTHYYIYCVYPQKGSKELSKDIKAFDKYLKDSNIHLYDLMYSIGQIRYNRKTNFFFVKISPLFFSKLITMTSRLLKRKGV